MKKTIYLLVILSIISGCKKNENKDCGKFLYTLSYTISTNKSMKVNKSTGIKSLTGSLDTLYTQFGDYITSLTPDRFTAKFQLIRLNTENSIENGGKNLELISSNAAPNAPERYADFTNNSSVSITPNICGNVDNNGMFTEDEIIFTYFYFGLNYFYQEVNLPVQYNGINMSQFNHVYNNTTYYSDTVINGNILKVDHFPLIDALFSALGHGYPSLFVFGNTDSTYISTTEGNNPIYGFGSNILIRSNKYSPAILYKPSEGESININTILSFNTNGLIQVYAGPDNIPYTSDDVFVYAPNFWERLSVNVISH